ncbi:GNAT family N-acetyltransferase [Aquicoccus sp.]|uniref:GNAT family N-acetyltransferase n=1 Tax=Aquicoccus sp. TaxID=2055851 RepID=UPI003567B416
MIKARIRLATEDDVGAMDAMLRALSEHLGDHDLHTGNAKALHRHGPWGTGFFEAVIAEAGANTCGMSLYFRHFSTLRGEPGVYVQDLWIAPEQRGSGLGRRLLAAVAREAAGRWDAAYLMLTANRGNSGAVRFYDRLGFERFANDLPMALVGERFVRLVGEGKT